jgi:hypothetical protein
MCIGSSPKIPDPAPPVPPPQASKAPEQETFKRKNIANARSSSSGNSGTILTGASGDAIPQGQLGTNTLLGG